MTFKSLYLIILFFFIVIFFSPSLIFWTMKERCVRNNIIGVWFEGNGSCLHRIFFTYGFP